MAEYYEAKEISEKLIEQLKICKWESIENGKQFKIELPVVLYFNYQRLVLNIYPADDGYFISDDGESFAEFSRDAEYYYDLFNKNDHNRHYDIKEKDGYLFKKYHFDYSLMSAIDEFVRFFIFLDIFMQESNMV